MIRVGFIGLGRMGQALAEGAVRSKVLKSRQIVAFDLDKAAIAAIKKNKFTLAASNRDVVQKADLIFLCVKPQQIKDVLDEIAVPGSKKGLRRKCVVSIAAGVTLSRLEDALGREVPVIRVMPNTPALLGAGMSAFSPGRSSNAKHEKWLRAILGSVGDVVKAAEADMDTVTAVSGSGPAYAFYLAEAMIEAALKLGLGDELARRLVHQTLFGAGMMLAEQEEPAQELRRQVTSPGGTTEAAINEFESRALKQAIVNGIEKAAARSKELAGS